MKYSINELNKIITKLTDDAHLINTFNNCFFDTKNRAIKFIDDESFIVTGDIPAMWLRDSSAQVMHYLPFVNEPEIKKIIRGLIKRQLKMILIDPYANAFKFKDTDYGEWDNKVITNPHSSIVWERKFELDSLCYPLNLIIKYYEYSKDKTIFNELFYKSFDQILNVISIEQNHEEKSEYFFAFNYTDSQKIECKKNKYNPKNYGLVWTGFRPSDDICKYHYHIPDNMFLVSVLFRLQNIFNTELNNKEYALICKKLYESIKSGIEKYGIQNVDGIGKVYVSETDCNGNYSLNDDANIPSLLSIPYLQYPFIDKEIYANTRKYILSTNNAFYFKGKYLEGIGSPHTKKETVWPLSIIMQGLTSNDENEIKKCLNYILSTDAGKELIHESINVNNPFDFTRPWFGWANSLFAEFALKKVFKII